MTVVRVAHADADYDVVIGPVAEALPKLNALAAGRPLPVISDRRVFELHGKWLANEIPGGPILIPEGEQAKCWAVLKNITDQLADRSVNRGTPIIAFGGGSVGDVAALAASLFKRGCPVIHVPTTLLAQADSAIGGKTAIDAAGQKNLVGTFHHPALVIADAAMLGTLDRRQVRSGYAEVVKYGLIDDADFFAWCEANGSALIEGDVDVRNLAIEHCVRSKARFVSADPDDTAGTRALLNFGHTFGHAIEAAAGDSILHGEAVAIGMSLAFRFSVELGLCPSGHARRLESHLAALELPTTLANVGLSARSEELLALMLQDKKAGSAGLALILTRGIGMAMLVRPVDGEKLAEFVHAAA